MTITYKKIVVVATPVIGKVLIHLRRFVVLFPLFLTIMVLKIQPKIQGVIGQKVAGQPILKTQVPEFIAVPTDGHQIRVLHLPVLPDREVLIGVVCMLTLKHPGPVMAM